MTNDLKKITNQIDKAFTYYFQNDSNVETIFVAGSMALDDYQDRIDNDYDIRVISKVVTREQIIDFENFLKLLSEKLTTKDIAVGYSCLVGPVNHKVSHDKKNILIHAMIHEKNQMDDFLPVTHKYQYGTRYRIVNGYDSLKRFQDVRFDLNDLLNAHEGLKYCIDMLKKREYRYLTWDTDNNQCVFNYHAVAMEEDTVFENCFYSFNKFITNLLNYCEWNNYIVPENKQMFAYLLADGDSYPQIFDLIHGLLNKDEEYLKIMFKDPVLETINLLERMELGLNHFDEIFKKDEIKVPKLIK